MRVEKNRKESFGAVRLHYNSANIKIFKEAKIKARKGLTYDNRIVLYAFPHRSRESELAKLLHGEVIHDEIAKGHIKNKHKDAILGPILRLIKRITNKA